MRPSVRKAPAASVFRVAKIRPLAPSMPSMVSPAGVASPSSRRPLLFSSSQSEALRENKTVASYEPPFGHISLHGWNLERYVFYKLKSGDYKVSVTAGDRVTGGSREFFIMPQCFEAKTYEEFLDRYLEIVPAGSFGLGKKELLPDEKLKKFLGY